MKTKCIFTFLVLHLLLSPRASHPAQCSGVVPQQPILTSPLHAVTIDYSSQVFSWDTVPTPEGTKLLYALVVNNSEGKTVSTKITKDTSTYIRNLENNQSYYWTVFAISANLQTGSKCWSPASEWRQINTSSNYCNFTLNKLNKVSYNSNDVITVNWSSSGCSNSDIMIFSLKKISYSSTSSGEYHTFSNVCKVDDGTISLEIPKTASHDGKPLAGGNDWILWAKNQTCEKADRYNPNCVAQTQRISINATGYNCAGGMERTDRSIPTEKPTDWPKDYGYEDCTLGAALVITECYKSIWPDYDLSVYRWGTPTQLTKLTDKGHDSHKLTVGYDQCSDDANNCLPCTKETPCLMFWPSNKGEHIGIFYGIEADNDEPFIFQDSNGYAYCKNRKGCPARNMSKRIRNRFSKNYFDSYAPTIVHPLNIK